MPTLSNSEGRTLAICDCVRPLRGKSKIKSRSKAAWRLGRVM